MTIEQKNSISVIIVSYFTGPYLWLCLESLRSQELLEEIILVDNGNPENVKERLRELAKNDKNFKYLEADNVGFAAGCNLGASKAQGKYIAFINPDSYLPAQIFARLIQVYESTPNAMLITPLIIGTDGKEQRGNRRNIMTLRNALCEMLRLDHFIDMPRLNLLNEKLPAEPTIVPAISGAFMMMTHDNYRKIGGLDEGYFLHVEDMDFCLQATKLGGKCVIVPDCKIVHFLSTSDVESIFIEKHKMKGFLRFFAKNYEETYSNWQHAFWKSIVYLNFGLKVALSYLASFREFVLPKELNRVRVISEFLETYKELPSSKAAQKRLAKHAPFILSDCESEMGAAITRRLIGLDQHLEVCFNNFVPDFEHSNMKLLFDDRQTQLSSQAKTAIYSGSFDGCQGFLDRLPSDISRFIWLLEVDCPTSYTLSGFVNRNLLYIDKVVEALKARNIDYSIIRYTTPFGLGLDGEIACISNFIQKYKFFPDIDLSGLRSPTHVDDIANAVVKLIEADHVWGKTYDLAGEEIISMSQVVGRTFKKLGISKTMAFTPFAKMLVDLAGVIFRVKSLNSAKVDLLSKDLVLDKANAVKELHYEPQGY